MSSTTLVLDLIRTKSCRAKGQSVMDALKPLYRKGPHYVHAKRLNSIVRTFGKYLVSATSQEVYRVAPAPLVCVQSMLIRANSYLSLLIPTHPYSSVTNPYRRRQCGWVSRGIGTANNRKLTCAAA